MSASLDSVDAIVDEASRHTLSDPDRALTMVMGVLEVAPWHAEAHNLAGVVLSEREEYETALEHLARAAELAPRSSKPHYDLGVALMRVDRVSEARRAFETAVSVRPDYVHALLNLGACYGLLGDVVAAAAAAERVRSLDLDGPVGARAGLLIERLAVPQAGAGRRRGLFRRRGGGAGARSAERQGRLLAALSAGVQLRADRLHTASLTVFTRLLDFVDEDSAGQSIVEEYVADCCFYLGRHVEWLEHSTRAASALPCVRALVPPLPFLMLEAGHHKDVQAMYAHVISRLFDCKCGFVAFVYDTDSRGTPRISRAQVSSDRGSFSVRRAGNVLRIQTPDGDELERVVHDDSQLALDDF